MRSFFFIPLCLALTACHQSQIQGNYHGINETCRGMAEAKVAATSTSTTKAARNAELVTVFSDCMAKRGWAVAAPKRAKAPSGSKPKEPPVAPAQPPAPAAQPAPVQPVAPTAPSASGLQYQYNQPVVQPADQPGYSIYQPLYPKPEEGVEPPATAKRPSTPARY